MNAHFGLFGRFGIVKIFWQFVIPAQAGFVHNLVRACRGPRFRGDDNDGSEPGSDPLRVYVYDHATLNLTLQNVRPKLRQI